MMHLVLLKGMEKIVYRLVSKLFRMPIEYRYSRKGLIRFLIKGYTLVYLYRT